MAIIVFNPKDNAHVAVIISWWMLLEPEREHIFYANHTLSAFLDYFNSCRGNLLFSLDTRGIVLAAWTEALLDGAEFGLWVRPDHRHSPTVWKDLETAYKMALEVYPVLFSYTRQPALHARHLKLGYSYCGKLPLAWRGQAVWLYALTRENWANRQTAAKAVRERKRGLRPRPQERPMELNGLGGAGAQPPNGHGELTGVSAEEHEDVEQQSWFKRTAGRFLQ